VEVNRELIIGVGAGLYGFAKLPTDTLAFLIEHNSMEEFHRCLRSDGYKGASCWLEERELQPLEPLTLKDVSTLDISNWIVGRARITSAFDPSDCESGFVLGANYAQ
jgi:hypothetical protein